MAIICPKRNSKNVKQVGRRMKSGGEGFDAKAAVTDGRKKEAGEKVTFLPSNSSIEDRAAR